MLLNGFWLILSFFALPGNWLMIVTTVLFSIWQKDSFSIYVIIIAIILAVIGEIIEFLAGAGGAKLAGGGKKAILAAIAGAIVGAVLGTVLIPVPLFGTLLGSAIGTGMAVLIVEEKAGKEFKDSVKTATTAGIAQMLGTSAKVIVGLVIWLVFAITAFV
ncbi:MAG: DUF456 family protein [Sedimentisphaerales bacterium]|nr:DUF456 family protein [Sedimentisphaerales bacterium]